MRVTLKHLESQVKRLNEITGSPIETWIRVDGKNISQLGNYHLDGAYGGWKLSRIVNKSGAIEDITRTGFVSKKELYHLISAYMDGIESTKLT